MTHTIDLATNFNKIKFDKAQALLSGWNFSLLKEKLLEPDYAGWTQERIDQAEKTISGIYLLLWL